MNQAIKDDTRVADTKGTNPSFLDKITFNDKKFIPSLNMFKVALEELNETERQALFRVILENCHWVCGSR